MAINPPSGASAASGPGSGNQLPSQPVTENQFLTLLAAELQYQDPTQPVDPTQFVSELAQFATLASTNQIASSVQSLSSAFSNPLLLAAPLLGKTVSVNDGSGSPLGSGTVTGLALNGSQLTVDVSGVGTVPFAQVVAVSGA
jgi:flagellar basal-body rod modification protein FlgD